MPSIMLGSKRRLNAPQYRFRACIFSDPPCAPSTRCVCPAMKQGAVSCSYGRSAVVPGRGRRRRSRRSWCTQVDSVDSRRSSRGFLVCETAVSLVLFDPFSIVRFFAVLNCWYGRYMLFESLLNAMPYARVLGTKCPQNMPFYAQFLAKNRVRVEVSSKKPG